MQDVHADAYIAASTFLVDAVGQITPDQWDGPGVGTWNLRNLVAHANRAHRVLEQYLYQPIEAQGPEYFADDAIEARGREAALSLGADPLVEVSEASAVAIDIVRTNPPETTLGSPLGTVTLAQYVPSRTAELTIHTLDIVGAIGSSLEAPSAAVADSLAFVAGRARGATAQSLLLALTGRCELPPGFSLYSR